MPEDPRQHLSVFVPGSLRRRVRAIAALKGVMVSDLVTIALGEYLEREQAPEDRKEPEVLAQP